MNRTPVVPVALAASLVWLAGCGGDDEESTSTGASATAVDAVTGSRPLDEDTVEDYLAAMADLRERGLGPKAAPSDPSAVQSFAQGLAVQDEWKDVLDDHDLDAESFLATHVALVKAYGKLMMDEKGDEVAKEQQKAYEQMKASMGEQAAEKMLAAQRNAMDAAAGMFGDVPAENVALVKKVRAQLEGTWRGE